MDPMTYQASSSSCEDIRPAQHLTTFSKEAYLFLASFQDGWKTHQVTYQVETLRHRRCHVEVGCNANCSEDWLFRHHLTMSTSPGVNNNSGKLGVITFPRSEMAMVVSLHRRSTIRAVFHSLKVGISFRFPNVFG